MPSSPYKHESATVERSVPRRSSNYSIYFVIQNATTVNLTIANERNDDFKMLEKILNSKFHYHEHPFYK